MSFLLSDLHWRGLIHQTTDDAGLEAWLEAKPRTIYVGFDPTADSLHVGHMMGLLMLRRFQKAGHRPIAVVGGATGMIGDPSGKSAERNLLSKEQLAANVAGMAAQMRSFLDFDCGPNSALLVNNYDWTSPWSFLEFLRDIGKNFPVNVMLAKDSVKSRLGRGVEGKLDDAEGSGGMSYTEFSYMLLQAYDFLHLYVSHACELQGGGSDQWGNITAGIDLTRRMRGAQLHGLTWPLLTKSDGSKMGKTESGAVWLAAERTSPYQFYQYWINVPDADVGRLLRQLTELSRQEVESLDAARTADAAKRESQRRLAEELTRLVHGDEGLVLAQRETERFFGGGVASLDDAPSTELPASRLTDGTLTIVDALCEAGLASSKSEARRTIAGGGAYLNNARVETPDRLLTAADLTDERAVVLRSGKKKYALLRFA